MQNFINQPYGWQNYRPPQQAGISGRVIMAQEAITANDVPMDGTMAYFPLADGSLIYAKQWCADGTIRTTQYKPILDVSNAGMDKLSPEAQQADLAAICGVLDSICGTLTAIADAVSAKKPKAQTARRDSNEQ